MKIPQLTATGRSRFYPIVMADLKTAGNRLPITSNLGKAGGFSGAVKVQIKSSGELEFEANVVLKDWTFFPARIRAASTALRDSGLTGSFDITHADGLLTIK